MPATAVGRPSEATPAATGTPVITIQSVDQQVVQGQPAAVRDHRVERLGHTDHRQPDRRRDSRPGRRHPTAVGHAGRRGHPGVGVGTDEGDDRGGAEPDDRPVRRQRHRLHRRHAGLGADDDQERQRPRADDHRQHDRDRGRLGHPDRHGQPGAAAEPAGRADGGRQRPGRHGLPTDQPDRDVGRRDDDGDGHRPDDRHDSDRPGQVPRSVDHPVAVDLYRDNARRRRRHHQRLHRPAHGDPAVGHDVPAEGPALPAPRRAERSDDPATHHPPRLRRHRGRRDRLHAAGRQHRRAGRADRAAASPCRP